MHIMTEEAAQSVSISAPFWHGAKLIIIWLDWISSRTAHCRLMGHVTPSHTRRAMAHTRSRARRRGCRAPEHNAQHAIFCLVVVSSGSRTLSFQPNEKETRGEVMYPGGVEQAMCGSSGELNCNEVEMGETHTHVLGDTRKKISTGYMTAIIEANKITSHMTCKQRSRFWSTPMINIICDGCGEFRMIWRIVWSVASFRVFFPRFSFWVSAAYLSNAD